MIGRFESLSGGYLRVLAAGILLAFGVPMLLSPLRWAAALGWDMPADPNLALYFGRCLAGLVCVLGFMALRVAGRRSLQPLFYDIVLAAAGMMAAVHAYGALRGVQPLSETIEIAIWLGLVVLTLLFYPRARVA